MTKKIVRSIMIGFCVFVAALIISYITLSAAYKTSLKKASEALSPIEENVSAETGSFPSQNTSLSNYYIARFNGETLAIYICTGDREEFLYTLDARIEDISPRELSQLKEGIILPDKQALASFEEDFTS